MNNNSENNIKLANNLISDLIAHSSDYICPKAESLRTYRTLTLVQRVLEGRANFEKAGPEALRSCHRKAEEQRQKIEAMDKTVESLIDGPLSDTEEALAFRVSLDEKYKKAGDNLRELRSYARTVFGVEV